MKRILKGPLLMYAKLELTRQVLKILRWKLLESQDFFIGPFIDAHHRNRVMGPIVSEVVSFLQDKPYIRMVWEELDQLPKDKQPLNSEEAASALAYAITDW